MHWHAFLLRLLTVSALIADEYLPARAIPAPLIVPADFPSSHSERSDAFTSYSEAVSDCLAQNFGSHGALLVFRDGKSSYHDTLDDDSDVSLHDLGIFLVVNDSNEENTSSPEIDADTLSIALKPRTIEPLGLLGSIRRTFRDMPFSQRLATFSTFFGAISVPAYLYNAAQGFDEEEIARLKAEAIQSTSYNSAKASNDTSASKSHETHGHVHSESGAKKTSHSRGTRSGHAKIPGRAMPIYAVRPRDITVPSGKDVNIVINFEPVAGNNTKNGSPEQPREDHASSTPTEKRSLASAEEAALIEKALKNTPRGSRHAIIAETGAKREKAPNETVGKLLEYTGMSTAVLYTLAALNSLWRAAIIPDTDLKKYRRAEMEMGDEEIQSIISPRTAFVCLPYKRHGGSRYRLTNDMDVYDDADAEEGVLLFRRHHLANADGKLAKRGLPAAVALEAAGKHAKTLGIGGIGVAWGFMMHNMGQRRNLAPDPTGKDAFVRRATLQERGGTVDRPRKRAWTPGRGSILFASVLAGTSLAKAGLGVPELHPTVVEEETSKTNASTKGTAKKEPHLARRGVPSSPGLWSTLHRGLNDKVTIALGSMAASALAVKTGLAGDVVDAIKSPFKNKTHTDTSPAGNAVAAPSNSPECHDSCEVLEKRQLGRGVTAAVGGFTGLYLAQHLGSSGQQRENKIYKQQLGLQRRSFETGSSSLKPLKAIEEVFTEVRTRPHMRTALSPAQIRHLDEVVSRHSRGSRYFDGSPRGRAGYEQAKAKSEARQQSLRKTEDHKRASPDRGNHKAGIGRDPDLVAEVRIRPEIAPSVNNEKKYSKSKLVAAGVGGAAAGAYIDHKLIVAAQKGRDAQIVEAKPAPLAVIDKPLSHKMQSLQKSNTTSKAVPDDVLSKTKGKGKKIRSVRRVGNGIRPVVSKTMLRPLSPVDDTHVSLGKRDLGTNDLSLLFLKRGAFNTALFGALVGTTGAATLYSWKHDDPGTRKVRHVPAGFLENATTAELKQPAAARRSLLQKRSLYSSLAKAGARIAKSLPSWMKTSKAKGIGAIGGGLALSTTAALIDDGPKEAKKKPGAFKETPENKAKNVFANSKSVKDKVDGKSSAEQSKSRNIESDEAIYNELERRASLLAPLKALKQLHADVVLHHGKTAGNALIVGGVAATAGATGLLKRDLDKISQYTEENDEGQDLRLQERGVFGSNVFKMIDVASLAVPAGAIIGGLTGKAVHSLAGKKGKTVNDSTTKAEKAVKRSSFDKESNVTVTSQESLAKRKFLGMSNLGLASLATMGGGLLASPIKSLVKGAKGGSKSAGESAGAIATAVKREEKDARDNFETLSKRGAAEKAAVGVVKRPQTKVLGMSLLSAASMSTMFGFLLAPPIKSAWKKHQKAKEDQLSARPLKRDAEVSSFSSRATINVRVPNYSDYLDEMLVETHKKAFLKRSDKQSPEIETRELQQTIDYKFGKNGGEFKVSFSPYKEKQNGPLAPPRESNSSVEAQDASLNQANNPLPDDEQIAMPINDTLVTPKKIKIHAHEDDQQAYKHHNATLGKEKDVEIEVQKRCTGEKDKPKGKHPSIEAHRALVQKGAAGNPLKRKDVANTTIKAVESDQEDKIEYDVNKDGAHFEATFVARQPNAEAEAVSNAAPRMARGRDSAITKAGDGDKSAQHHFVPATACNSSDMAPTERVAVQRDPHSTTSAEDARKGKTSLPVPSSHLESVENTIKTEPSGVTTVTTRISPLSKRCFQADR